MGEHSAVEPGTIYAEGDPAPPTTTAKAPAGFLYGLIPVLLGAVVTVLQTTDTLWPDAPPAVKSLIPVVLILLGPVLSYFGVNRTPNLLKQPVQVLPTPAQPAPAPTEQV
jgi:hypothetical protein